MASLDLDNVYGGAKEFKDLHRATSEILAYIKNESPAAKARNIMPIPRRAQDFHKDLASQYLVHPRKRDANGMPVLIDRLTGYQETIWEWPNNLFALKSQKLGVTTSSLEEDFQFCLLPETAGLDVIVTAPNQVLANDHIRTLKYIIDGSPKYRHFLIKKPEEFGFKEEKSKLSVAFIRNQYNPRRPSRIIGLGNSLLTTWSWKNVGKLHMSDAWRLEMEDSRQEAYFMGLFSRLANTQGRIKIETPPNGQQGYCWTLYEKIQKAKKEGAGAVELGESKLKVNFDLLEFNSDYGVAAGVMTQEWLDEQRALIGDLMYDALYRCKILASSNQWYKEEWFREEKYSVDA